jgi:PTH1 family peptidyl-tRNA hydrolase
MPIVDLFKRRNTPVPTGAISWIIAGLGNPGQKYEKSRHNAGFLALDRLAGEDKIPVTRLRFKSLMGDGIVAGGRVLLLKPQTFMNNSGEAVREALSFYKLPPERLLVIYDDISLPCGRIRVRPKGSDGGHNGIKSILYQVQSDDFPRVKIGVGSPPRADYDLVDWVLGSIPPNENEAYQSALSNAVAACREIIKNGCDSAMNLYNSK